MVQDMKWVATYLEMCLVVVLWDDESEGEREGKWSFVPFWLPKKTLSTDQERHDHVS